MEAFLAQAPGAVSIHRRGPLPLSTVHRQPSTVNRPRSIVYRPSPKQLLGFRIGIQCFSEAIGAHVGIAERLP